MKILSLIFFLLLTSCENKNSFCNFKNYNFSLGNGHINTAIACSDYDKQQGFMNQKEIGNNQGILFVFKELGYPNFWMKDTPIPLSIVFLDNNLKITDIRDMQPFDIKNIIPNSPSQYALETKQGWFKEHNVSIGDTLHF